MTMRQGKLSQFLTPAQPTVARIPRACKTTAAPAPAPAAAAARCDHGDDDGAGHAAAASCGHGDDDEEQDCAAGDTHHCGVCEGRGQLLLCDGPCGRGFHASCMPECPDTGEGEPWHCKQCRDRVHDCFICFQDGEDDKGQCRRGLRSNS
jgi:hypothetical protein